MTNSIQLSRRRQIEVSDVRERVQKRLSVMRAEIKLPLQRIRYVSGLDILCIAAEAGLKGLRTHRDIKIEELQSLPEEVVVEDFVDEDDVQHIVWSNTDDLEADIEMAADALNELRKAQPITTGSAPLSSGGTTVISPKILPGVSTISRLMPSS
ncbi:MAG: hypothetical protein ABF979_12735 [Gluconobacter sp.]|uniref:hypothetical protein n=1 Tax=Gluconobacter sp. TaxID=1876758 RepID=UPI0039EB853C